MPLMDTFEIHHQILH